MISASDRLKNERKRLNKTQEYVATACEIAVQSLRNYESGKRKPDIDFLRGLPPLVPMFSTSSPANAKRLMGLHLIQT